MMDTFEFAKSRELFGRAEEEAFERLAGAGSRRHAGSDPSMGAVATMRGSVPAVIVANAP